MKLLAIETSSSPASIALLEPGNFNKEVQLEISRSTSMELLPAIADLFASSALSQRDLNAIAVAVGPGSYTGIRVGMATAQGIAEALNIPVHEVSSLAGLASQASVNGRPIAVMRRTSFVKSILSQVASQCHCEPRRGVAISRNHLISGDRHVPCGMPAERAGLRPIPQCPRDDKNQLRHNLSAEYFFCIFESLEQLDKKIIEEGRYKGAEIIKELNQLNRPCHLLLEGDILEVEDIKGISVEPVMPKALSIGELAFDDII